MALYDQPINMVQTDAAAQWYPAGYGNDKQPAMTVHFYPEAEAGIMENAVEDKSLVAYPNPATDNISVLLNDNYGKVTAVITTLDGKTVSTQNVSMDSNILNLDVTTLASGTYVVNLNYDNNNTKVFKMLVTK